MRNSVRRSSLLFYAAVFAALFMCAGVSASAQTATAGQFIISEFRYRGPNGANDEFIEIYNNSGADHVVTAASGTGYGVAASDGTTRCSLPNGTFIANRGHYLCVNSVGYSLASYPAGDGTTATGDATYTTNIPENLGIAIFNNNSGGASYSLANRLDAVGSASEANPLYKEGTGLPAVANFAIDYAWVRDTCGKGGSITAGGLCPTGGFPKDTDNNGVDFYFVDTAGTPAGAVQHLGAPGPENSESPVQVNESFSVLPIDECVSISSPPNRVRDFTSDPTNNSTFGTLDLRKTVTNNTGFPVLRLRWRIIDLSTYSPPPGVADLRPRTSTAVVVTVDRAPCGSGTSNVTVQGTTLEQPPSQPIGGGFNSSLSSGTVTLDTPLANGDSIDIRFLLGIQQTGSFKFFVNAEAVVDTPVDERPVIGSAPRPSNGSRKLVREAQSTTGARAAAPQTQPAPQAPAVLTQAPQPAWVVILPKSGPEKPSASKKEKDDKDDSDEVDADAKESKGAHKEQPAAPPA